MIGGQVASYELLFYGGPKGYQTNRAQIYLLDAEGRALAFVRFKDPGMKFQKDVVLPDGVIRMHLPSAMFHSVLDVLRNEKPVYVWFPGDNGFLGTSEEPIGEGEA